MDLERRCVTFAGAVGSSKSPIAHHLSYAFNLPILSYDTIRTEVAEDLLRYDHEEYEARRIARLTGIFASGKAFILDGSVDRSWGEIQSLFEKYRYQYFVISLDLSKEFLTRLYEIKGYSESLMRIDQLIAEHDTFLSEYGSLVGLHIRDGEFGGRLSASALAVEHWLHTTRID